jgi:hypothetical protein
MSKGINDSFALKLQDATVDVERLGELFLINREQVRTGRGLVGVGRDLHLLH